ncbi:type III-B CRISPR module RAMP protein Cmr6 [Archaeoglobus sp.]
MRVRRVANLYFPLPKDLRAVTQSAFDNGKYKGSFDNVGLVISKYAPFTKIDGEFEKPKYDRFGYQINLPDEAIKLYEKHYETLRNLWVVTKARTFSMKTKSRLIIGLGDESVYETSIRLHRNYGVPYIPGSALKGVAKHYAIQLLTEANYDVLRKRLRNEDYFEIAGKVQRLLEESEESKVDLSFEFENSENVSFEELRMIFGTQKREGSIIFFDAFPTPGQLKDKLILELDVMNPHYQPYYSASGKELQTNVEKAPGDWHNPTPIFFLTVPKGVEFQFAIAPRSEEGAELLDKAKDMLVSALKEFGVGAKTSLGYGRFE